MIASLRGTLIALVGGRAVVDVNGVGYAVALTERHARALRVGDSVELHTALIVREDDMSLFGFLTAEELAIFELLRTVSGVGPKSALGVLGAMEPSAIARAIAEGDDVPFRAVSGIGPKTAKLITVSLAGKLVAPRDAEASASPTGSSQSSESVDQLRTDLVAALTGLGWPERSAVEVAASVIADESDAIAAGLPVLLRKALAQLGPRRSAS